MPGPDAGSPTGSHRDRIPPAPDATRAASHTLLQNLVPLAGIEPALSAPEADALSAELQGQRRLGARTCPDDDPLQKGQL